MKESKNKETEGTGTIRRNDRPWRLWRSIHVAKGISLGPRLSSLSTLIPLHPPSSILLLISLPIRQTNASPLSLSSTRVDSYASIAVIVRSLAPDTRAFRVGVIPFPIRPKEERVPLFHPPHPLISFPLFILCGSRNEGCHEPCANRQV